MKSLQSCASARSVLGALLFTLGLGAGAPQAMACTTTIVTPGASADGCMMVSHSDDNDLDDQSIVYVPARDWPEGS